MSPLVRSLLALAALFATAATLPPPPQTNCTEKIIGRSDGYEVTLAPIYVPPPGGIIDLKDVCPIGSHLVGARIRAFNNDVHGKAPKIDSDNDPLEVGVWCTDRCPKGLTVFVTEYCSVLESNLSWK